MSFLVAEPELVAAAATHLGSLESTIRQATAAGGQLFGTGGRRGDGGAGGHAGAAVMTGTAATPGSSATAVTAAPRGLLAPPPETPAPEAPAGRYSARRAATASPAELYTRIENWATAGSPGRATS